MTASGGACDIICDAGSAQGIEVPDFAPETVAAIEPLLPPFATAHNPLDVTGYGLANAPTGMLTSMDYALKAAIADPGLDFILFGGIYLPDQAPPEPMAGMMAGRLDWITERMADSRIPVIPLGMAGVDLSAYSREVLTPRGIYLVPGLNHGVGALGHALRGLPLLQGARGTAAANLDAVAGAIAAIGDTALSLGSGLGALEVNPLLVNGDHVEALDVLVVTEPHDI